MSSVIRHFRELQVYKNAKQGAMEIFHLTRNFPGDERYGLVQQIRRSTRSVCANIAEAWHKRRYNAAFVAKLSDAESEAAETLVWLDFSNDCNYIDTEILASLDRMYTMIIGQLIRMIDQPEKWTFQK